MGRKVKCRFCGKELNIDDAYKVNIGKRNAYYCDQQEYDMKMEEKANLLAEQEQERLKIEHNKELRSSIYSAAERVCGRIFNKTSWMDINKTVSFLNEQYSLEQIDEYVNNEAQRFLDILAKKDFNTEFAKIRYYTAVVRNNISDYYSLDTIEIPQPKEIVFDMPPVKYKQKKKRRAMVDIENEVEEEDY